VHAGEEHEVLEAADAQVERAVAGRHEPRPARDVDRAGRRLGEAGQNPQQRRLAGAVGPEQRVDLAVADLHADAAQHLALAEAPREAADVDGAGGACVRGHIPTTWLSGPPFAAPACTRRDYA
jgi:hypothetical protein